MMSKGSRCATFLTDYRNYLKTGTQDLVARGLKLFPGQPPVVFAQHLHRRRNEQSPDYGGVHGNGERKADAHLLHRNDYAGSESGHDDDQQQARRSDDPPRFLDSGNYRFLVVAGAVVFLLDSADQKDFVVGRKPKAMAKIRTGRVGSSESVGEKRSRRCRWPSWKIQVIRPKAALSDSVFKTIAFRGITMLDSMALSTRNVAITITAAAMGI